MGGAIGHGFQVTDLSEEDERVPLFQDEIDDDTTHTVKLQYVIVLA